MTPAWVTALRFLLSPICDGVLAPEHLADLRKSGLTAHTSRLHGSAVSRRG